MKGDSNNEKTAFGNDSFAPYGYFGYEYIGTCL